MVDNKETFTIWILEDEEKEKKIDYPIEFDVENLEHKERFTHWYNLSKIFFNQLRFEKEVEDRISNHFRNPVQYYAAIIAYRILSTISNDDEKLDMKISFEHRDYYSDSERLLFNLTCFCDYEDAIQYGYFLDHLISQRIRFYDYFSFSDIGEAFYSYRVRVIPYEMEVSE